MIGRVMSGIRVVEARYINVLHYFLLCIFQIFHSNILLVQGKEGNYL